MKSFIVYKHTCPNNKCYIGITSYKNPNQRWRNGESYLGDKKHLTKWGAAIIKYGWENIKHEILHNDISKEEACNYEKQYIKYYKELNLCYNLTEGGDGIWGYKFTDEKKISESHKGLKQSQETINKRVQKNIGQKRSDISKQKKSIPVLQYDLNGNLINEYFGIREAERQTHISHIGDVCKKIRKTAGGYIWKFKDENHPNFIKALTKEKRKQKQIEENIEDYIKI